jgi:glycosyltransferase involved in cell wall biosynthesis
MRIQAATDNELFPPRFGGPQRTFGLCRGLARRHEVQALCVVPNRSRGAARQRADGVELVRRRAWYTSLAWRLERLGIAPLQVAALGHTRAADRLRSAFSGEAQVFAADLLLTGLFDRHPAPLKVYAAHNVERDRFVAGGSALSRSPRWISWIAALEERAVHEATLTVTCTTEDAERFAELYGLPRERAIVIPNGWDETRSQPATLERRARARAALGLAEAETVALFVGSDMPHNREAVRLLVHRVLPSLAGRGLRLVVAGSVSRALAGVRDTALRVAGEVEDLEPWLHAADVGINPVRSGGGSNVKLPTYLAAGLAVVTTAYGLRGYPELAPLVTTAEPDELADALRERPRGWAARGLAMPAEVAALSWGALGERLGERFAEHLVATGAAGNAAPVRRESRA